MSTPARQDGAGAIQVMHVVFGLHPGGMEYGLAKLVNGLAGGPIRSSICSTCPADPVMAQSLRPEVRLFELVRRKGNDPLLVWRLYRLFRRERPDIVHTHAWGTLLEGLVAARLARVPLLLHGEHGTLQVKPYQAWMQRWAWRRVDGLLSVSLRLAERMSAVVGVPLETVTVLRNGVDVARFSPEKRTDARRALGVDDEALVVGHAGRLVAVKDQAALVEAAAQLKGEGLRFRVLIAGDGPLRGSLEEQIAALGVGDCVTLLGHVHEVEQLLAALDVYVLCSRSEGMPNTVLEAMACGVPVVSTRVGGADELVVDAVTGLLVPPARPDLLASALGRLLRDSGLRAVMGAAGRLRACREFSVEAMIRGYRDTYVHRSRAGAPVPLTAGAQTGGGA
jgi:sugar transferase (PEP-CTERM/EpsH1 system associated)